VVEFQERGAIHFHIATTLPEPTYLQREIFADIWTRISTPENWSYCPLSQPDKLRIIIDVLQTRTAVWSVAMHPKSWEADREENGMSRYLAKYANKLRQKEVPANFSDVGRFWGVSRGVSLPQGESFQGSEEEVRQVLWLRGRDVQKWEILPKTVLC